MAQLGEMEAERILRIAIDKIHNGSKETIDYLVKSEIEKKRFLAETVIPKYRKKDARDTKKPFAQVDEFENHYV